MLAIALVLIVAIPSYAQYNIHLKNGSVIRGVGKYEEVDGELRFRYMGGTMGIPLDEVLKVEEVKTGGVVVAPEAGAPEMKERREPVVPSYQMEPLEAPPDTGPIKESIAKINQRLAEIGVRLAERDKVKEEYDRVRLRIEVLFQKGIAEAKRKGGDPAKWFQFLPAQEREWAQLNTLKKNKLKKDLEALDQALAPLIAEKEALLEEKRGLEEKLRELESPF
jgi:hypothetical protein